MSTLYESILSLCQERGIKGGKMCVDLGLSKSLMTDLKAGRKSGITSGTAQKIADYFGVSVDRVLGTVQKEKPAHNVDELDEEAKELRDIWDSSDSDDRQTLLEMARLLKKRRK